MWASGSRGCCFGERGKEALGLLFCWILVIGHNSTNTSGTKNRKYGRLHA